MEISKKIRGGLRWARSRLTSNSGILLYHRVVEPENDRFRLCVSPENFEEHIKVIAESGGALTLPELVEFQKQGELPEGSIAITFDDGYLDNLESALPILRSIRFQRRPSWRREIWVGNFGGIFSNARSAIEVFIRIDSL